MRAITLLRELLRCRREIIKRKKDDLKKDYLERSYLKNHIHVEVKDTGGRTMDIKSVKIKQHGRYWWTPTIEITLTSKH